MQPLLYQRLLSSYQNPYSLSFAIEAIEAGQAVTNERALSLAKRIADRRHQAQANAQSK